MRFARATGRNAAGLKYDMLTALGTHACAGDKHLQRLTLRFITLIVARYNWQADELCVGQREMAALWSVDERTVKRDVARLRDMGWLVVKRQAARGRVAVHGVDLGRIMACTQTDWARIGPDFVARMATPDAAPMAAVSNVIAFPAPEGQGVWARAQGVLQAESPALYAAWFAALSDEAGTDSTLRLRAPTRFHAAFVTTHYLAQISRIVCGMDAGIRQVAVVV